MPRAASWAADQGCNPRVLGTHLISSVCISSIPTNAPCLSSPSQPFSAENAIGSLFHIVCFAVGGDRECYMLLAKWDGDPQ